MSSEQATDEQKAANLARIRDNQRRSRARRKEYLQELEGRYRLCEQLGVEASAEMQAAARRVIDENRRLRLMLKQHGYTDHTIDQAVFDGSTTPAVANLEDLFGKRMRLPGTASSSAPEQYGSSSSQPQPEHYLPSQGIESSMGSRLGARSEVPSQPPFQYDSNAQWHSDIYGRPYPATTSGMPAARDDTSRRIPHFEVPSLQTIKTEIGYDPQQEDLENQSAEIDYSLSDEQAYNMMKRYP